MEGVHNVGRLYKALHYKKNGMTIQVDKRLSNKDRIRLFFKIRQENARAYIKQDRIMSKLEALTDAVGLRHKVKPNYSCCSQPIQINKHEELTPSELNEADELYSLYKKNKNFYQVDVESYGAEFTRKKAKPKHVVYLPGINFDEPYKMVKSSELYK